MGRSTEAGVMTVTVFEHHIYEFRKGIRCLILHTLSGEHVDAITQRLKRENISYVIYPLDNGGINVFFGKRDCVEVIKTIGKHKLNEYTPEEDFILGIMLGYGRLEQCQRLLFKYSGNQNNKTPDFREHAPKDAFSSLGFKAAINS